MKHRSLSALVALIFAIGPTVAMARPTRTVLPADTVLRVQLDETLSSNHSRPGDHFTATLKDPSFPSGTLIRGVVTSVRPANGSTPGRIGVDFQSLEMPNGKRIPIAGTPIALNSKNVKTNGNGRLVAKTHSSPNMGSYIGYGAAGGLVVGSLFGKNVIGGLLGSGVGYLLGQNQAKAARNRDVNLKSGTELGVRLDHRVVASG
ncbi:MAG: Copper amine oxidase N-terminal domain [Chthonomonadaceae bacterium]|nr:Copper amine oxidase N-terminal domain [Chthonomonadaceae bacterium]